MIGLDSVWVFWVLCFDFGLRLFVWICVYYVVCFGFWYWLICLLLYRFIFIDLAFVF